MLETNILRLCESAGERACHRLPLQADSSEVLEHYWGLQDTLARLIQEASEAPLEMSEAFRRSCPNLFADSQAALDVASQRNLTNIAAVRLACKSIYDSLVVLQTQARQRAN